MPRAEPTEGLVLRGTPSLAVSRGPHEPEGETGLPKVISEGVVGVPLPSFPFAGVAAEPIKDGGRGHDLLSRVSSGKAMEFIPKSVAFDNQGIAPDHEAVSGVGAQHYSFNGLKPLRSIDALRQFLLETIRAEIPPPKPVAEEEGVKKAVGSKRKKAKLLKS